MKRIIVCLLGALMLYSVNQIGNAFSSPIPDMDEAFSNQAVEQFSVLEDEIVEDKSESTDETESSSTQSSVSTETEKKVENEVSSNTTTSNSNSSESKKEVTESQQVVQSKTVEQTVQEPPKHEQAKTIEPQQVQNNTSQPTTCGLYQSITNCKYDYDSSSACYSAGDKLTEMYLNDWMDYNDSNPNNPISREIQNTECYSVYTDNGVKWYLLVVCYGGSCSKNYKSIYLGK